MTLGKGLLSIDDLLKFAKIVDKLAGYCYMVNYIPKQDYLVLTLHKKNVDKLKKDFGDKVLSVKLAKRGVLAYAKLKWR